MLILPGYLRRQINPFQYPGGIPGYDPTHVAAGQPLYISAVAHPSGNTHIDVISGKPGTIAGTPGSGIKSRIGPAVSCGFTGTSDTTAWTGRKTGNTGSLTTACICMFIAAPRNNGIFFGDTGNVMGMTGSGTTARITAGGTQTSLTGFSSAAGQTFFIAASATGTTVVGVKRMLDTGKLQTTSQVATAFGASSQGSTYNIGNLSGFSNPNNAWIAATMWHGAFTPLEALVEWSNDPWSFWYPDFQFARSKTFLVKPASGAAVIDVPSYLRLGTLPSKWLMNAQLLRGTAQDTSSSAVETNPHWQGKTYPPQWLTDRKLIINHRAVVESSSAVETNPHTAFKTLPPQWVNNPILLLNTAQDFSSSAVETNPHWKGIQWPPQWQINRPLFRVTAQDFSASAVETNVHTIFKTFPPQWLPLTKLRQNDPQDFSSSAVETNPHWLGKTWPSQWTLILKQSFDPNSSTQVQPETNIHFIPRAYPPQWAPLKNLQNTAQDFSSSAVETNVHTIFKTWATQWKQTVNLLLNADTLAPTFQPETNVHFIPRTWAPQWVLLLRTQNTAQDFSSSAVETNPHWIGRPWPVQWVPARQVSAAVDAPSIISDTPPHTIFRTWLPQWLTNLPLLRGTAQDFSSIAIETNVHFIPRTWPPQWNLQASLKQGTAQDFSTAAPTFIEIYENQFFSAFARIGAIGRNP